MEEVLRITNNCGLYPLLSVSASISFTMEMFLYSKHSLKQMSVITVNPLKEENIPFVLDNIKYHEEYPSQLLLKLEQTGNYVRIALIAKYKQGYRHCGLGSYSPLCSFASQEQFDELKKETIKRAKEFYEKTLEILHKGNYELHIYDDGELELRINGKLWKVQYPENLVTLTS